MSTRPHAFQSSHDTMRNLLKWPRKSSRLFPSPTPPGPLESNSAVVPPVDAHQSQPLSGPSTSGGTSSFSADSVHYAQLQSSLAGGGNVNHFNNLLNGAQADARRTLAQDLPSVAYEGFKGVVAVADTVGYALPPLKAAAAGASRAMTVIDKARQNERGFEKIQETVDAILSIVTKHRRQSCEEAPEEALAGPSRLRDLSTAMQVHKTNIKRVQKHGVVRRAIENVKDASLVTQSLRNIGLAKGIFDMDTMLNVESMAEDILRMLKEETTRRLQTDTVSYVETSTKEILQLLKDGDTTRSAQTETMSHVQAMIGEVLHTLKDAEVTRASQMDAVLHAVQTPKDDEMTRIIQSLPHAKNASYQTRQAPDDVEPQGCMEGTRVQILAELEQWAFDDESPKVCWLNGMAGTGKSSIAHSLSQRLDEKKMLGASFFCSRSASKEARDASLIIPTIAYQLSRASSLLRSAISQTIEDNPDVGSLQILSMQFRTLLVEPIQRVLDPSIKTYKLIIIDALDECTKLGTVERLIQSIVACAPEIPLKFFISSRDITGIQNAFHHNPVHLPKVLSLHSIERTVVQDDIKTYLQISLSEIARRSLQPISWPPHDDLRILVERSDRLFIYAATAVRYIGVPDVDFGARLTHITRLTPSRMRTGVIDSLYNDIMKQAFHSELQPDEVSLRREILAAVVFLLVPLSTDAIASLLNMERFQARLALVPFRSVIHMPAADTSPVSVFHASFRDFIVERSRCEDHFLDVTEGHWMLTVKCLRCLNQSLKRNICNLDLSQTFSPSEEIISIHDGLRYSCLHWASHLVHILEGASGHGPVDSIQVLLSVFVNDHLLHWFECLSCMRELGSGVKSLERASEATSAFSTKHMGFEDIARLLKDALRFLQFAFAPINRHPLDTYDSALVWIPKKSMMRERYADTFRRAPQVLYGLSESWGPALHVISYVKPVTSIAFSPDGSRIVVGIKDDSPEIWNTATGEKEGAYTVIREQRSIFATPVAFSPDGSRIASGSGDCIVRIWNTATGEQEAELKGHMGEVTSVAFSHEGDLIVSGSWDKTVRVWNTTTYETELTLSGHLRGVMSVAVTSNDKYIVSGSDTIVRIWDIATGQLSCELMGPLDRVTAVAASSDSLHIAALSYTELWVWDVDDVIGDEVPPTVTGMTPTHVLPPTASCPSRCLIRNKSNAIVSMSVAFSPDGRQIAATAGDKGVYIWCAMTGTLMDTLNGHSDPVTSVAFSPDGSRVASGSWDRTVRIWDADFFSTGRDIISTSDMDGPQTLTETQAMRTPEWSSHRLMSCALSRDGSRVVIGTMDGQVYVWNHVTNTVECELRGHSLYVESVAFSNDGNLVISGSLDRTIRIWNCHTKSEVSRYRHSYPVTSVAFSRDGSRAVFGSPNKRVQIWNPETGQIESKVETPDTAWSIAFSHDDSYIICGCFGTAWIWNLTTNEINKSTPLSGRFQLPDGTLVHHLDYDQVHIYDPVDQGATDDTPAYVLSIPKNGDWIIGDHALHSCWIPPRYQDFESVRIAGSTVCLLYELGRVVILDLKRTPHV